METQKRQYGLFTSIAMIVGIVIGSGIFFKSDNILVYTQGNVMLGILLFCIAAFAIIFGSLSISQLASLTDNPGGFITYAEEFVSPRFGAAFGWFQVFIYYPSLVVVVSWVIGIYMSQLFGWDLGLNGQVLIGILWFILCFAYNTLSAKIGGYFQNASTIIKLIPLFVIAISGLLFGEPANVFNNPSPEAANATKSLLWMAGIGPIAYSFDGWIIATAVAHEVKDSKKNMPRALVAAPLFILGCYLLYFIGICSAVGTDQVMALGDGSAIAACNSLFGENIAKLFMVFVVISVMGTVNGIILGYIRIPYSLSLKEALPIPSLKKVNESFNIPIYSSLFCFIITLIWWAIHYFTMRYNILANSDVSEIAIVVSYILYIVLYYQVFRLWKKGQIQGVIKGIVFPVLATMGSLFIMIAGLQNPLFLIYVFICFLGLLGGWIFYGKKSS
ncbi:APC family permease [Anaerovorax sp. IOR16]|uniref:APC family permease n=1 Tax=Anaerovorax sp. IOR16 TaxID=2773458 RepID=UPI0019D0AF47|nr:APC family permease [Anaerovorax sp. IOR16]